MAKPKTMSGYVAIVLNPESMAALKALAVHPVLFSEHTTLAFKPEEATFEERFGKWIDQPVTLQVLGMGQDDKGQAVRVLLPDGLICANANPHVTISCAEGIGAKYSNDLLGSGLPLTPVAITELQGVVQFKHF